jgi:hypothetical protein
MEIEISKHLLNIIDEYVYYEYKEKFNLCIHSINNMNHHCANCDGEFVNCYDDIRHFWKTTLFRIPSGIKLCNYCSCFICPKCESYEEICHLGYLCRTCDEHGDFDNYY